jgi:ketosteroid isomerase-like protein
MADVTVEEVQEWLDAYVAAWKSYDPAEIGGLFTEDAIYHRNPSSSSARGRPAIVAFWMADKHLDAPGLYDARYKPVLIDGNLAVTYGRTEFFGEDGTLYTAYHNVWFLRFSADGRCSEFHESYTAPPGPTRRELA